MTAQPTNIRIGSRFGLRMLFVAVAACALAAVIARGYLRENYKRAEGKRQWSKLCKDVSLDPTSLEKRVDEFLSLEKKGRIIIAGPDFMFDEVSDHRQKYVDSLGRLNAADFINSVGQLQRMKAEHHVSSKENGISLVAAKLVTELADKIGKEQEAAIAPPLNSQAPLNKLVNELAFLKNGLSRVLWYERYPKRRDRPPLAENLTWEDITGLNNVPMTIRPALVPVILHDLEVIAKPGDTLSNSTIAAFQHRVTTLRWLCEVSEDEFVVSHAKQSE